MEKAATAEKPKEAPAKKLKKGVHMINNVARDISGYLPEQAAELHPQGMENCIKDTDRLLTLAQAFNMTGAKDKVWLDKTVGGCTECYCVLQIFSACVRVWTGQNNRG